MGHFAGGGLDQDTTPTRFGLPEEVSEHPQFSTILVERCQHPTPASIVVCGGSFGGVTTLHA